MSIYLLKPSQAKPILSPTYLLDIAQPCEKRLVRFQNIYFYSKKERKERKAKGEAPIGEDGLYEICMWNEVICIRTNGELPYEGRGVLAGVE